MILIKKLRKQYLKFVLIHCAIALAGSATVSNSLTRSQKTEEHFNFLLLLACCLSKFITYSYKCKACDISLHHNGILSFFVFLLFCILKLLLEYVVAIYFC
jgi:hypothetical protein